jgi:BRCT domain type II-containing protein
MPAQTLTSRSASSAWTDNRTSSSSTAASRPTSRYSDRASSAASNVSLKDTIDVFVEDHFLKSYNLQYEPVRIRIGNDAPGAGNLYQSQPSFPGRSKAKSALSGINQKIFFRKN